MKRIQCLPINTATFDAYGLHQEPDLRKLTLFGYVHLNKNTFVYEIAQRQWVDGRVGRWVNWWMNGLIDG